MVRQSSEQKFCGNGWDRISGGKGSLSSGDTSKEVAGEDPCIVQLDRASTENDACWTSDNNGSRLVCVH
jgi:hypothetical protein